LVQVEGTVFDLTIVGIGTKRVILIDKVVGDFFKKMEGKTYVLEQMNINELQKRALETSAPAEDSTVTI